MGDFHGSCLPALPTQREQVCRGGYAVMGNFEKFVEKILWDGAE